MILIPCLSGVSTCSSTLISAVLFHSGLQSEVPSTSSLSRADVFLLVYYGVNGISKIVCMCLSQSFLVAGESCQLDSHSCNCDDG